jgi:hypothetical protein
LLGIRIAVRGVVGGGRLFVSLRFGTLLPIVAFLALETFRAVGTLVALLALLRARGGETGVVFADGFGGG